MAQKNENKTDAEIQKQENSSVKKSSLGWKRAFVLILLAGGAWGIYQNPQIVNQAKFEIKKFFETEQKPDTRLQDLENQVSFLRNELMLLQQKQASSADVDLAKVKDLFDKFDQIEKSNMNIIDSKADVAVVLGLLTRLDDLEQKVKVLSRANDESALILTSTMLVKDAADKGVGFVYEAEVLRQLAVHNPQISEPLSVISQLAEDGLKTNAQLINQIESIYKTIIDEYKKKTAKNWKERLLRKLNDFVQVRRVSEGQKEEESVLQSLKKIVEYSQNGDFVLALAEAETQESTLLYENKDFVKWLSDVKRKVAFLNAVNKITANTLAIMKVDAIKKEI